MVANGRHDLLPGLLEHADGARLLLGLWRSLEEQLDRAGSLDAKERRRACTRVAPVASNRGGGAARGRG